MNTEIRLRFLTPYLSSLTRDQAYVHSPLPIDGALAHAIYWEAVQRGVVADSPSEGRANPAIMQGLVLPELRRVLRPARVGDLLNDPSLTDEVFAVSSGFPVWRGEVLIRRGAQWVRLADNTPPGKLWEQETQPIRKRVDPHRLTYLGIEVVTRRGIKPKDGIDTSRGPFKAIDNSLSTWRVYEYAWWADVLDEARLRQLLEVLAFQGIGKKRSAGFGKVAGYSLKPIDRGTVSVSRTVFLERRGESILLRPLPYDAIMMARSSVVMTNLMMESGCGFAPPYWSDRRVVVREGTIFGFL